MSYRYIPSSDFDYQLVWTTKSAILMEILKQLHTPLLKEEKITYGRGVIYTIFNNIQYIIYTYRTGNVWIFSRQLMKWNTCKFQIDTQKVNFLEIVQTFDNYCKEISWKSHTTWVMPQCNVYEIILFSSVHSEVYFASVGCPLIPLNRCYQFEETNRSLA